MNKNDTSTGLRRLSATFDGRVQGIGFRFTTVEIARHHAVTGYVQNLMDGSVKLIAEGEEEELLRFLDALRESHVFRYVTSENLAWGAPTGDMDSFVIRYA